MSSSAATSARRAVSRSGPWAMTLPSIGSYDVLTTWPDSSAWSTRTASPAATCTRDVVPGLRQEAAEGVLGVDPRLDRVAADADHVVLAQRQRRAGRDPQLLLDQVERPAIASVTGCSTWRRVFISRK